MDRPDGNSIKTKARALAFSGIAIALALILNFLSDILSWNTLFLLALAAFLMGTVCYLTGSKRAAFTATVAVAILTFWLAPNKIHVFTFLPLAFYVQVAESIYMCRRMGKQLSLPLEIGCKIISWYVFLAAGVYMTALLLMHILYRTPQGSAPAVWTVFFFLQKEELPEFLAGLPAPALLAAVILLAGLFGALVDRAYLWYAMALHPRVEKMIREDQDGKI